MCEPNAFYLRVFTFQFHRENIIPGNLGFATSVCRLRERGRMSKCVCACGSGFRIIMFFVVRSNDSFNFPLGLIKYIVKLVLLDTAIRERL